ncbi:hypothetical protein AMS68_005567 [Peltaster fructicola]|uniref:LITAF domain-containing protein n=1 Tax=Peltaster fructicola TaxID=286661 RepID=A0A6H0Y071_9PEZI|nr:hypothetical protein AMS68_005567 [Peltaster fructicola]
MGVIENPTGYQQQTTGTTANDMAINQSGPAPPSYENEKSQYAQTTTTAAAVPAVAQTTQTEGVPGQPRTDDPARAEMTYNNNAPAMVTPREALGYDPAWIDCPFCHQRSMTNVRKAETDTTWIYTLLCCLCCGCIGAIFPLIFGWGADFDHYCNTCNNRVARRPHEGSSNTQVQVFGPVQAGPGQVQQVAPIQQPPLAKHA